MLLLLTILYVSLCVLVYAYRLSKKSGRRERESITFVFDKGDSDENWKTCTLWHKALNLLLRGVTDLSRLWEFIYKTSLKQLRQLSKIYPSSSFKREKLINH